MCSRGPPFSSIFGARAPSSRRSITAVSHEAGRGGMLGRCPRSSLHRTGSKGEPSHEILHLPSSEGEMPLLQPPHQIVIGFDLGGDSSRSSHTQAVCESPRSVLEPHHLCFRSRHQSVRSPRSPISALGSLLSGSPRNIPSAERAAFCFEAAIEEVAASVKLQHALSRCGPVVDADGVHGYSNFPKTEHAGTDGSKTNKQNDFVTFSRTNCVEARKNLLCKHVRSNASRGNCDIGPQILLSSDGGYEEDSGAAADDADSKDGDTLTVSIFSTASPVANYLWSESLAVDFLSKCYLCRRRLLLGKDIYMYKGDRAFCSKECRYKQIVADERRDRCPAAVSCVPGASSRHQSFQSASQVAAA